MNRKDFGRLIATLRKEQHDYRGNQYTQARLAELTNTTEQVVGRLERGEKVIFEPETLTLMANTFKLSSRERQEFFLAAAGINDELLPSPVSDHLTIFSEVKNILRQVALPSFVVDSYDNVVLVNQSTLALFEFIEKLREQAPTLEFGFNLLRFVFSTESQFYDLLIENRDDYLLQTICFFKSISFACRATSQYEKLIEAFTTEKEMSRFAKYFNLEKEGLKDYFYENNPATIDHLKFGKLKFYSPATTTISSSIGALHIVSYLPADLATINVFSALAQENVDVEQICPWPMKEFPVADIEIN